MANKTNPYAFKSVIFDLDGVITKTALVHAAAWKEAFDEYLRQREARDKETFREFTHQDDYLPFVDGKPRYQGVKSFLESRGINIPFGEPSDSPDAETVCGIGNRKNQKFTEVLRTKGAEVYPSTIELIRKLKDKGIRIGVASSSKNCKPILEAVGLEDLFETRVDGVVSAELGLQGKPEGDIFVRAAANLGTLPCESIVVEDATSGVAAGRNGAFGLVLGIAREDNTAELIENGADLVVDDLKDINIDIIQEWFQRIPRFLDSAWDSDLNDIEFKVENEVKNITVNPVYLKSSKSALLNNKKLVFFLDYDGTLTPIVSRPELAIMSEEMREVIRNLSKKFTIAIVSGRARKTVEDFVKIDGIFYAGSHGFDIKGPEMSLIQPAAENAVSLISKIIEQLKKDIGHIEGVIIEDKKFSVGVHYRLVDESFIPSIKKIVEAKLDKYIELRLMSGKKVFEILPAFYWDKGKAMRWILEALDISFNDATIVYIGDDTTDEDAFRMIRSRGVGILVADEPKPSSADFLLRSCREVKGFFEKIINNT
jgi:trehalose 6-phosphate phosphatase